LNSIGDIVVEDGRLVSGYLGLMGGGVLPISGSLDQMCDDEGFNSGKIEGRMDFGLAMNS